MITFSNVAYSRAAKPLVTRLDTTLFNGEKVGIVGANGCGKSTLFQLILGEIASDQGEVELSDKLRIAQVKQETPGVAQSALNYVLDGDQILRKTQADLRQAESDNDGHRIAELHEKLENIGAYDVEARASRLLYGLGFSEALIHTHVDQLSGGWRVRLNLAQALLMPSDILLLDEPTNHLDLDAVFWLESFLKKYPGTLLVISHDRDFLDALVEKIWHFESTEVKCYSGNYSQFLKLKAQQEQLQAKMYEKQQAKVAHLQSFIDRFKAKASKAKQAQSRVKALEKMASVENIRVRERLSFEFFDPLHKPDPLLKFEKLTVGYQDTWILNELDFSIRCDSRIGLLGRNGAGKSTLLKAIANTEVSMLGERQQSKNLQVGYFAQHQLEQLNGKASAFSQMQQLDEHLTEQEVRNYLGGYNFHGDKVFEPVESFSGGEKARLVLALMIYQKPNLILLDEPTNHLDMEMRDALTLAIQNFAGAVVLISHDRFLLDATVDELYLVDSGRVCAFDGDTQQYHQWLKANRWGSGENEAVESSTSTSISSVDRKKQKQLEAQLRQAMAPLKKQLQTSEQGMEKMQVELNNIEQEMSNPELYQEKNKALLTQLIAEQSEARAKLDAFEAEWFELQDQIEQQQAQLHEQLLGEQ
ncbi:ATP-binding cassette domain-containing protein [Pleionea litopenaei]|uniref:Probable ATP-binding protein YheS n=1 Tax=Pleionea litopenaei TaxID=3070815 RepID=A0AA51X5M1_9GAMM|nr:ATP-binding cassette domain-containing protein [Pleionea sp. HL-JVS1]WMS86123.1 ATP-binding cassette domain-containing protein [Pleionea sp. HL-JVS1]